MTTVITVREFQHRVSSDCTDLVKQLQSETGRFGSEEADAWRQSLPKLSAAFESVAFQPLHLYFGGRGNLAIEYQLPAAPSWCDVVLLGKLGSKRAAVIIELKNWQTRTDKPGSYEGLIERHGGQDLHPSDQVRGYVEYCSRFHSTVAEYKASVSGCVLFTADKWASSYGLAPNDELTREYPYFTTASRDIAERFPAFFANRLSAPDEEFAKEFARGIYKQNRGFVAQIGQQILHPEKKAFELLDNQRKAFNLCEQTVKNVFLNGDALPSKHVVIVKGPPGSGKSAIAARLWAALVTNGELPEGNVVFTSTSLSQYSNLRHLVQETSGLRGAGGVVRKATWYSPVTTHRVGELRARHGVEFLSDPEDWRGNLQDLINRGETWRDGSRDDQNLVSIVDEAHALINPEHKSGRGQFGFAPTLGPQAYHIIRSSLLTVFFLDPVQAFRERENTTLEDLSLWSRELGAGDPVELSLDELQFRCAGSTDYIDWIESVLSGAPSATNSEIASRWYATRRRPRELDASTFDFRLYDSPKIWEKELQLKIDEACSVRLLATYSRKWKTRGAVNPHKLSAASMDFHEAYHENGIRKFWSRVWNFVPKGDDYSWFVSANPKGKIANDPLCEVGCTYAVRGFDFDYVGVLWLDDLLWRNGRWAVNPHAVYESGITTLTNRAKRESNKPGSRSHASADELLNSVLQAYRIIFTRAIRGTYVWIPDLETRGHLEASLGL
jgi:hypothetical protein